MRGASSKWTAGIAAVMVLLMPGLWWRLRETSPAPVPSVAASNVAAPAAASLSNSPVSTTSSKLGVIDACQRAVTRLTNAHDAAAGKRALEELRRSLASGDKTEASAAIRRFLDSRVDTPTGLGFKIGSRGVLTEAPTLRTYLLDYLGQIDPATAADYARVILSSKDSPDEWAVALRNLALGDTSPAAHALLEQKTGELLSYGAWQQNPSTGYLEAFDAAVYLGGTDLIPTLTGLARLQDNPAVAHAAFLALDRSVINDPTPLLTTLLAQPELMQGREQTRADFFARADVRDPQQRQLVENYLLSPQTSPAELQQFAGVFPSANYMISQNLLTPTPTPDSASLAGRDAESLLAVQRWQADPRFAGVRPQLEQISVRLGGFVKQETTK
jgi:hypothetical protein